jgi:hypothetical protein
MKWYAVFKKDLPCIEEGFTYLKGKKYVIELEEDNYILVRQPNSPKDKNWVTKFNKPEQKKYFDMVEE